MSCAICGHAAGTLHLAREMMFGLRDEFRYFECGACGCVQLQNPPAELGKYYPHNYYSFKVPVAAPVERPPNRVRRWANARRNEAQALARGGFWGAVATVRPRPDVRPIEPSVRAVPDLRFHSRVLDVGCGGGNLLAHMAKCGFRRLTGIDPFLSPANLTAVPGVTFLAERIEDHTRGPYDLVMMHHSLEHMPDQVAALTAARRLLAPGGTFLVRVPTASSAAWREYGTDWVDLDAPRHFFIHSHESLRRLATRTGFAVRELVCDGVAFCYAGSELYQRGLPLVDPVTRTFVDLTAIIGETRMAELAARAAADNARLDGAYLTAYLAPV